MLADHPIESSLSADHRKRPQTMLLHQLESLVNGLFRVDADVIGHHGIPYPGSGIRQEIRLRHIEFFQNERNTLIQRSRPRCPHFIYP